jgi:hypothetical protein
MNNTLARVKRHVMEPNLFLGYLARGVASVLSNFGHEQYPCTCQKIYYGTQCIYGILLKGY